MSQRYTDVITGMVIALLALIALYVGALIGNALGRVI